MSAKTCCPAIRGSLDIETSNKGSAPEGIGFSSPLLLSSLCWRCGLGKAVNCGFLSQANTSKLSTRWIAGRAHRPFHRVLWIRRHHQKAMSEGTSASLWRDRTHQKPTYIVNVDLVFFIESIRHLLESLKIVQTAAAPLQYIAFNWNVKESFLKKRQSFIIHFCVGYKNPSMGLFLSHFIQLLKFCQWCQILSLEKNLRFDVLVTN